MLGMQWQRKPNYLAIHIFLVKMAKERGEGMEIIRVIISGEKPKRCRECQLRADNYHFGYCYGADKIIECKNCIPAWCPLEVEEEKANE
jgi:hypothetical protein